MARLPLGEIFVRLSKMTKNAEKVEWLRKQASPSLFYILKLAFSEVEWNIPSDAPPFKQWTGKPGAEPGTLMLELRRMYIFLAGGADTLPRYRREMKFQSILEALNGDEVAVLISTKDKRLDKQFNFTRKVVEEAFPGLLEEPVNIHFGKSRR